MTILESLTNLFYVRNYQNIFIFLQYDLLGHSLQALVKCLRGSFTKSWSLLNHGVLFVMMKTPARTKTATAKQVHMKELTMSMSMEMEMMSSADAANMAAAAHPVNLSAKHVANNSSATATAAVAVAANNCCICDEDDFEIIFDDLQYANAYACSPTDSNCSSNSSDSTTTTTTSSSSILSHQCNKMTSDNMSMHWFDDDDDDHDEDDDDSSLASDSDNDENDVQLEPPQKPAVLVVKKVRFDLKPKIYVMRTWTFAYQSARKGGWEQFARDRCRFQKRIQDMSEVLNPILDAKHRNKIYENRFKNALEINEADSLVMN